MAMTSSLFSDFMGDGHGLEFLVVGFVLGAATTLAIQGYLLWRFLFCMTSTRTSETTEYHELSSNDQPGTTVTDNWDESSKNIRRRRDVGRQSGDDESTANTFQLPRELAKLLLLNRASTSSDFNVTQCTDSSNSCLVLNLVCQFLFRELRDTVRVRRWFMQKLSVEFEELLQKTTVGKLLEKITDYLTNLVQVRDLNLGHQFPVIKSLSITDVRLDETGHIEELDVIIDLHYEGGFQLAVDADLMLQRSAFLAVRVAQLSGRARLRFSRCPYTHWSFAFCVEPQLDVQVESHFQGRPLPHVTSIIVNQIRRLVRKKHTLPNFKIRYRPFFDKPASYPIAVNGIDVYLMDKNRITEGLLDVTIVECSRLFGGNGESEFTTGNDATRVYCTLALDSAAWVESVPYYNTTWLTLDVTLMRQPSQAVGITFRQEFILSKYEYCVVVDSVVRNSPARVGGIHTGDILVAINGSKVVSASQAAKLCKAIPGTETQNQIASKLTFRIERMSAPATVKNVHEDNLDTITVQESSENESMSPRKGSLNSAAVAAADKTSVTSGYGDDSSSADKRHHIKMGTCRPELPDMVQVDGPNGRVTLKRTSTLKFVRDPIFRESFHFEIENEHRFLNVCVWRQIKGFQNKSPVTSSGSSTSNSVGVGVACGWGTAVGSVSTSIKATDKIRADVLLGHVSVSLLDIAMECTANSRGAIKRRSYQLVPPEVKATVQSRSRKHGSSTFQGFDKTQCYGDITLSFIHKPQIKKGDIKSDHKQSKIDGNVDIESDIEEDSFSMLNDSNETTALNEKSCERLAHDFIITQFNTTVSCNFCGKKVWFKIAFKCRSCGFVCHKKCVAKCRDATSCNTEIGSQLKPQIVCPQITKTDASPGDYACSLDGIFDDDMSRTSLLESPKTQRRLRSLLSNVVNASENNDNLNAIDGSSMHNQVSPRPLSCSPTLPRAGVQSCSRSLPPSPQISPATSRKASLQGNPFDPFVGESSIGDSIFNRFSANDDIGTIVERLLQYANDETVVSIAKEKGRELFANDPLHERMSKLDSMVSRLEVEIDQETERRNFLAKNQKKEWRTGNKRKCAPAPISQLLAKSDEKIQALSILMLFYCSGLQHCHELEEANSRCEISSLADGSSDFTEFLLVIETESQLDPALRFPFNYLSI